MFLNLSKMLAKFGGVRLGLGIRITKKNAIWMLFVLMFVYMLQAMWYLLIVSFWLVYAVCYGCVWCVKKLIGKLTNK